MRLNAPIPALLALVALFLLPATLLAKTTHRHAHRAATSHKHSSRNHLEHTRVSRRHRVSRTEIAKSRTSTGRHLHRPGRLTATSTPQESKTAPSSQKATSDDFIKAASPHTETSDATPAASPEIHAEVHEPAHRSRSRNRHATSAARPVSVVSVIRHDTQRPQLQDTATEAASPVILPALYNKRGRLVIPPPLKGSREILLHQNEVAERDGLSRIQNDEDLLHMRDEGMLVALPVSGSLDIDQRLPFNRRYCRPWTARFLANLSRAHYARFHTPLQVNSAVRTVEFQEHLMHINGNAAPAEGDTASPHLTGQAVDLAKHGLSRTEIAWMRGYLLPLIQEGKIDVEEEFQQSCFHISVYESYVPPSSTPRRRIATTRHSETSALAVALH
jgi:hypothetical protein